MAGKRPGQKALVCADFTALLADVKSRIQAAQTRAVLSVNAELVRLYWDIGQISLPGGGAEPGEAAQACALREFHEELGVDPARVQMLGSLPPIYVYASKFLVRPFVALATQRPAFRPDSREVAELLELPVPHLVDERNYGAHTIVRGQLSFEAPCITFRGRHIWGATALILGELLNVIVDHERGSLFAP